MILDACTCIGLALWFGVQSPGLVKGIFVMIYTNSLTEESNHFFADLGLDLGSFLVNESTTMPEHRDATVE